MNSLMSEVYPTLEMYQALRTQLMERLTDEELAFTPGGANPTLGALCREMGEVQHSYIESFKTFSQSWHFRNPAPEVERSVAALKEWYAAMDHEMKEVVAALTEDDLRDRTIDRGPNFAVLPRWQLDVYREALLIFYGKASVYAKAMRKPLPEQWQEWIA